MTISDISSVFIFELTIMAFVIVTAIIAALFFPIYIQLRQNGMFV
jgi:hypothetical protein